MERLESQEVGVDSVLNLNSGGLPSKKLDHIVLGLVVPHDDA